MKYLRCILGRFLGALLSVIALGSCTHEIEQGVPEVLENDLPVKIAFNLRSAAVEDETINTVRFLLVKENIAGKIVKNIFIQNPEDNLTLELLSGNYRLYVVVNEMQRTTYKTEVIGQANPKLEAVRNYGELKQLTLDYNVDYVESNNLPMFGQVKGMKVIPSSADPQSEANRGTVSVGGATPVSTLQVSLERLVSKLTLRGKVVNEGYISSFYSYFNILDIPTQIPLFEDYEPVSMSRHNCSSYGGWSNDEDADGYHRYDWYRGNLYLPAYMFTPKNDSYKALRLSAQSAQIYDIPDYFEYPFGHNINSLAGALDYTLHRNCSYLLSIDIDIHSELKLSVYQWDEDDLDAPIEDFTILEAPDSVVMDWSLLNESYTTTVLYQGRDVKIFVNGEDHSTDSSLPDRPEWLVEAMHTTVDYYGGLFTFTYQPSENHDDYVIELRSGNLIKRIRVIYDNGFIPTEWLTKSFTAGVREGPYKADGSNLSKVTYQWTANLPTNGIHLAKRGGITHDDGWGRGLLPSEYAQKSDIKMQWNTEANAEGYDTKSGFGEGPANTGKMPKAGNGTLLAANYCLAMGSGWYLPSRDELLLLWSENLKKLYGPSYALPDQMGSSFHSEKYFSSTTQLFNFGQRSAYAVWPSGNVEANDSYKTNLIYVRCIRNR